VSPFGGAEGMVKKEETGDMSQNAGRQESGNNFKPLLPMRKTSTPGPSLEKEGELEGSPFLKGDAGGFFERLKD